MKDEEEDDENEEDEIRRRKIRNIEPAFKDYCITSPLKLGGGGYQPEGILCKPFSWEARLFGEN